MSVFSRKHYNQTAKLLFMFRPLAQFKTEFDTWAAKVVSIADELAKDSPRFDRKRFYAACGYCNEGATT